MLILWAVVFALSASKEYIDDTFIFTIDTSAGTARIDGLTKYVDEIIIPDTIVVDGNTFLVNSIQYINQTKKITLGKNINLLKTKCFDGNLEELIGIPNSYVSVNSYDTFQNAGKLERAILYLESSLQSNIFIRCTNLVYLEIHYKGDIDANNAYDHPNFGLTGVNLKFLRLYVEGKYVQNTDRLFFDTNPQVNFLEEFIIECTDTFATSKPLFSYNYKPNVAYVFQIKAKSITLCKDALSSADFHSIDLIADTIDIPTDFAVNTENLAGFYTSSEVQLPSTLEPFKHENLCYYYVTSDFEISDTVLPVSIYVSGTVNIASSKNDFQLGRLMLLNDTKVTISSSIQIGEVDIHGTSTIAASENLNLKNSRIHLHNYGEISTAITLSDKQDVKAETSPLKIIVTLFNNADKAIYKMCDESFVVIVGKGLNVWKPELEIINVYLKFTDFTKIILEESKIGVGIVDSKFTFDYFENNTARVNSIETLGCKVLKIPSTIQNSEKTYTVESIKESFSESGLMNIVYFPNSLKWVGKKAFYECGSLSYCHFSELLESLGDNCFYYCPLEEIDLSQTKLTTVTENCFYEHSSFVISLPNTLNVIGSKAFEGRGMRFLRSKEIVFPSNLVSIGDRGFYNCYKTIQKISLNEGLETIGKDAFYGASFQGIIKIPSTLKTFTMDLFPGSPEFDIQESQYYFQDGPAIYTNDKTRVIFYSRSNQQPTFTILSETIAFDNNAFENTKVEEVIYPNNFQTLGDCCFSKSNIKNVDISQTKIKVIPLECFYSCKSLSSVKLPPLIAIQNEAFSLSTVSHINFHEIDITSLGNQCFKRTLISSIDLSKSTVHEFQEAFYEMNLLESVIFNDEVTSYAFRKNCFSGTAVKKFELINSKLTITLSEGSLVSNELEKVYIEANNIILDSSSDSYVVINSKATLDIVLNATTMTLDKYVIPLARSLSIEVATRLNANVETFGRYSAGLPPMNSQYESLIINAGSIGDLSYESSYICQQTAGCSRFYYTPDVQPCLCVSENLKKKFPDSIIFSDFCPLNGGEVTTSDLDVDMKTNSLIFLETNPPIPETDNPPIPETDNPPIPETDNPPIPETDNPPIPETNVPIDNSEFCVSMNPKIECVSGKIVNIDEINEIFKASQFRTITIYTYESFTIPSTKIGTISLIGMKNDLIIEISSELHKITLDNIDLNLKSNLKINVLALHKSNIISTDSKNKITTESLECSYEIFNDTLFEVTRSIALYNINSHDVTIAKDEFIISNENGQNSLSNSIKTKIFIFSKDVSELKVNLNSDVSEINYLYLEFNSQMQVTFSGEKWSTFTGSNNLIIDNQKYPISIDSPTFDSPAKIIGTGAISYIIKSETNQIVIDEITSSNSENSTLIIEYDISSIKVEEGQKPIVTINKATFGKGSSLSIKGADDYSLTISELSLLKESTISIDKLSISDSLSLLSDSVLEPKSENSLIDLTENNKVSVNMECSPNSSPLFNIGNVGEKYEKAPKDLTVLINTNNDFENSTIYEKWNSTDGITLVTGKTLNCESWKSVSKLSIVGSDKKVEDFEFICIHKSRQKAQILENEEVSLAIRFVRESETPSEPESPSNTGAIVGGVIGGIAAVVIIALLVYFLVIRKKRNDSRSSSSVSTDQSSSI